MKLWESLDNFGREIEHRGLKIRQLSHDLLFRGLTGDNMDSLNAFSIEPYSINVAQDKIITDEIMRCIYVRRQFGKTR